MALQSNSVTTHNVDAVMERNVRWQITERAVRRTTDPGRLRGEDNVEKDISRVVRENIEAFNTGDFGRLGKTLTEDSVYEEFATQRKLQGRQPVVEANQGWKEAFPDSRGTIRSLLCDGNKAIAEVLWEGTHRGTLYGPGGELPPTGKRVKVPASLICTVQEGKIKETRHYFDMMTLLQQIGAIPEMKAA